MTKILKVYLLIIIPKLSFGQAPIVEHFTVEDGLPSLEIYYVYQDHYGYMWFCTDRGVSRYNGYSFTNFNRKDGLTHTTIFKVFEDSEHNLWFTAFDGSITIFDYHEKKFTPFLGNSKLVGSEYHASWIHYIGFRNDSAFLFPYKNHEEGFVYCLDTKDPKFVSKQSYRKFIRGSAREFDNLEVIDFEESANGYCFRTIQRSSATARLRNIKSLLQPYDNELRTRPQIAQIDGIPTVCLENGVFRIDSDGSRSWLLKDFWATSVIKSNENQFWVSTLNNGVFVLSDLEIANYSFETHLSGTERLTAAAAFQDQLIVGTNLANVFRLNVKGGTAMKKYSVAPTAYRHIKRFNLTEDSTVISYGKFNLKSLGEGRFRQGKAGFDEKDPASFIYTHPDYVSRFLEHHSGKIDLKKKIKTGHVQSSTLIGDTLYYVYRRNLFYTTRGATQSWPVSWSTLGSVKVGAVLEWNGYLVVLSFGDGVLFTRGNKVVSRLTVKEGLSSNTVHSFCSQNNHIWLGTNRGVSQVEFGTNRNGEVRAKEVTSISTVNGLIANYVVDLVLIEDQLFSVGSHGISRLKVPLKVLKDQSPKTNLIGLYHGDSAHTSFASFAHDQNDLELRYEAFIGKRDVYSYKYRLLRNGENQDWKLVNETRLWMRDLTSGNYVFEVAAKAKFSDWGETQRIGFKIEPRWIDRLWVRLLLIVVALTFIGFVVHWRFSVWKKEKDSAYFVQSIQLKNAELESASLRNQMSPHFIFNALNSIQTLIINDEKEKANEVLSKFSALIRSSLQHSRFRFVPLEHEIQFIKNYLDIEQQRHPDLFNYSVYVDGSINTMDIQFPPFLLQPICENAVKHAFSLASGIIEISVNPYGLEAMEVVVRDNGKGMQPSDLDKADGLGLKIIRDRLDLFRNEGFEARLDIEAIKGEPGTSCKLIVPVEF